jgi:hypothetical protein
MQAWLGIKFSRTWLQADGCVVKAAILLVICDMLAARQATGFPSATSTNFCTLCNLQIQSIQSLHWSRRDWEMLKEKSKLWKAARSQKERNSIWKESQIRWSSLNDLPYWNPVECCVAEAMHFDLLNNIQRMCRWVWGIDITSEGGDGSTPNLTIQRPPIDELKEAVKRLNECPTIDLFEAAVHQLPRPMLVTICYDNGLSHTGRISNLRQSLISLVRNGFSSCSSIIKTLSSTQRPIKHKSAYLQSSMMLKSTT